MNPGWIYVFGILSGIPIGMYVACLILSGKKTSDVGLSDGT